MINNEYFNPTAPELPANRKPATPVCELFEYKSRNNVWCKHCGRHLDLHTNREEIPEPAEIPISPLDPLRVADRDTFNAIYKGGNSSPFPYDSNF